MVLGFWLVLGWIREAQEAQGFWLVPERTQEAQGVQQGEKAQQQPGYVPTGWYSRSHSQKPKAEH